MSSLRMSIVFAQHAQQFNSRQWAEVEEGGGYWIDRTAELSIGLYEQAERIIDQWLAFAQGCGQVEVNIYGVIPAILRHTLYLREGREDRKGVRLSLYESHSSVPAGAGQARSVESRQWLLTGLFSL